MSGLRQLDLEVPARSIPSAQAHRTPQLGRPRGNGPRRGRPRGKADPVVVDGDAYPRGIRIDVDQRGICTGVTSDVAGALQDDLERMLDQRSEEHTSELQSLTNLVCRLLL